LCYIESKLKKTPIFFKALLFNKTPILAEFQKWFCYEIRTNNTRSVVCLNEIVVVGGESVCSARSRDFRSLFDYIALNEAGAFRFAKRFFYARFRKSGVTSVKT